MTGQPSAGLRKDFEELLSATADRIDARIDQESGELRDWSNERFLGKDQAEKNASDLREEFNRKVDAAIAREIDRMKLTVGSAWKVLIATVVIILGTGTFFTVKTAYDIDEGIAKAAQKEVAHRLDSDTSSSEYRKIMTRAVVDAYLIKLARYKSDANDFRSRPTIDRITSDQLISVLKDSAVSDRDFSDTVKVLVDSESAPAGGDADTVGPSLSKPLADAVRASSGDYKWLADEPEKRAVLLSSLKKVNDEQTVSDLNKIVRQILDTESNSHLISASIAYLQERGTQDAVPKLESIAKNAESSDERSAALKALARLDYKSNQVMDYVSKFPGEDKSLSRLAHGLDIASSLIRGRPSNVGFNGFEEEQDPSSGDRERMAQKLLDASIRSGVEFSYRIRNGVAVIYGSKSGGGFYYGLDPHLLVDPEGTKVINALIKEAAALGGNQLTYLLSALKPSQAKFMFFNEKSLSPHIKLGNLPNSGIHCDFIGPTKEGNPIELSVKSDGKMYCSDGLRDGLATPSGDISKAEVSFSFDQDDRAKLLGNDNDRI